MQSIGKVFKGTILELGSNRFNGDDTRTALAQAALGAAKYGPTTRARDPEAEEAKRRYFRWLNANFYDR